MRTNRNRAWDARAIHVDSVEPLVDYLINPSRTRFRVAAVGHASDSREALVDVALAWLLRANATR